MATVPAPAAGPPRAGVHPSLHYDARLVGRAWAQVTARPPRALPGLRVLVVPHHWVPGALILGPLRDLAHTRPLGRVVLVGPDHGNVGAADVSTSDWAWDTPEGPVAGEPAQVSRLVAAGLARRQPELLSREHSVAGLVPALARTLPGTRVLPLVLRGDMPAERVRRLGAALVPALGEDGVLVVAVDFAHGVTVREVPRLNRESRAALAALDGARLWRWGNEHLDSPEAILLAMDVARRLEARTFTLLADADASQFGAPASQPVTSYLVGYYH